MTKYTFTGEQLFNEGFHRLCAIIPPDAKLSPNSTIPPEQRGKTPGRFYSQSGTWAGYDWINFIPTAKHVRAWDKAGAGIGIVCGAGDTPIIGVDIDVTNADVAAAIERITRYILGNAPARTGRAPKTLLVYQLDMLSAAVTWRKLRFRAHGEEHLIEIRGKGQQFVAAGIHPVTGEPYTWDTSLNSFGGADGLPVIDHDDIDRFFERVAEWIESREGYELLSVSSGAGGQDRSGVDQGQLKADDLTWADRLVRNLPNGADDYPTRDDYIRVGCAIKATYADDEPRGFAAFSEWCTRWTGGSNDPDVVAADWSRMKPPFEVGARWLAEQARTKGDFNDAEALFTPSPFGKPKSDTPSSNSRQSAIDAVSTDGTGEGEFWTRYCWVEGIKRFADLKTGALLDKEQFNDRWLGKVGNAASGMNSPAGIYMQYASRRVVMGLTYRPLQPKFVEEPDGMTLNTWQPGPAHGARGEYWAKHPTTDKDVAPWLDLVTRLVPDAAERTCLLDWLAWQIQRPGEKCNWHPLIWGQQGIGKDTLFEPIVRGLGDSPRTGNAVVIRPSELSSDWTDWYENKSLVIIEEINSFERRAIADRIKPLLTNPPYTLRINKKNIPQYTVPNICNFGLFSNHGDATPLENSDRRYFVIHAAIRKAEFPDDYFDELYDWLDMGGDMLVCGWLGARALTAFRAKGDAPRTGAKEAMRKAGLGVIESILVSAIEEQDGVFERDLLTMRDIEEYTRARLGGGLKLGPHKLGQILRDVAGGVKIGRSRIDNKIERIWCVRRAEMYQSLVGSQELGRLYEKQRRDAAASRAGELFGKKSEAADS